jgi:hypothetical protein
MGAAILLTSAVNSGGTQPILGAGTVTMTGNAYTASASDYQQQEMDLAGTLSAAGTLTLPNFKGWFWYILNATTGGYAVTATAGTSGVAIANGASAFVRCDGAGNIAYVQAPSAGGLPVPNTTADSLTTLSRAAYQIQPIDTTGGSFSLIFPESPIRGDFVGIEDWGASSAATGVGANTCGLGGNGFYIQNPHTMVTTSLTYTFGFSSQDGGGSCLYFRFTGAFWKVVGG